MTEANSEARESLLYIVHEKHVGLFQIKLIGCMAWKISRCSAIYNSCIHFPSSIQVKLLQKNNMKHCFNHSKCIVAWFCKALHILLFQLSPFWIELTYFVIFSIIGFLALKASTPKTALFVPKDLDLFFMSVSSITVSSMSTVEMEVFSNSQLILITLLMFVGGEVFTSLLGLQLIKLKRTPNQKLENETHMDQIELGSVSDHDDQKQEQITSLDGHQDLMMINSSFDILSFVILCYLFIVHFLGSTLIALYSRIIPSARKVLTEKGLHLATFSVFSTVSTFTNCGFIPTNENMMVFKKNPGLLLIMIPQILLGNTLYPACLRSFLWLLQKSTKREELNYMLRNPKALGYDHLFPDLHSIFLVITAFGFIVVQLVAFGLLDWDSDATVGLSTYEKVVGSLFQVVNSRHSGEFVFDLSLITPAMIVLFVLMM